MASFLAASGVGHVSCADPEPAEPADLAPAGLILADLGSPRQEGAARAVERAAPEVRTGDDGSVPDLVVLTGPTLPDLGRQLLRDRVPHLALRTGEAIGVVGPLVQPGRSACLSCVDLRKTEADPQWPKILAQATFTRARPQACDTVLAAMTATLAAAQALAFVDRPGAVPEDPAERLAFFVTSRGVTNEVYYMAQKAARFLGTNNVDNSARLCHAPSTAAMKHALGVAATTCSYKDWYGSDLVIFFGANPANDQPVTTKYLHEAKKLGTKVVLVNPCAPST